MGAWTYSGNPGYSAKDAVRFLIQDTNEADQLLLDGEIEYLLSTYNDAPMNAAIQACEVITAKFSRMADEKVGAVAIQFSQKAKAYRTMADTLRARLARNDCGPFAGGISRSQKQATDQNTDRVRPDFRKRMMEDHQNSSGNPGGLNGWGADDGGEN